MKNTEEKEFEINSIINLLQNLKEMEIKENNNVENINISFSHNSVRLRIYDKYEMINEKNIEFK